MTLAMKIAIYAAIPTWVWALPRRLRYKWISQFALNVILTKQTPPAKPKENWEWIQDLDDAAWRAAQPKWPRAGGAVSR